MRNDFDRWTFTFDCWQAHYKLIAYLCSMKFDHIKNLDQFVNLTWGFIFTVYWVQFMEAMGIYESFAFALTVVVVAYPFTNYLSKSLLRKAMNDKNMLKFVVQFFVLSLSYAICIPFIIILFNQLEHIGIFSPSEFMQKWNIGEYQFLNIILTSLVINLSFCGIRFFEQNIRLQKELADSSLQILQAQINPHFMFNVLNHINILIRKEPELASSVLVQYTNILRYQLYNGQKETVSIRQEIDFLEDFIKIEKMRWKNTLDVQCSWDVEDDSITFPPLLLITFIENAFKHVSRSKTEKGYVHITLKQLGRNLTLTVENSKYADQPKIKKDESGIGLENIKKRLNILYANKYNLQINDSDTSYSTILNLKM